MLEGFHGADFTIAALSKQVLGEEVNAIKGFFAKTRF